MRKLRWISLIIFVVVGVAAAAPAPAGYTVGDLTVRLAALLDLQADTPEAARAALLGEGIEVRAPLSSRLRQGDAVDVLNQVGLQLTSASPEQQMPQESVDRVFSELLLEPKVAPAGDLSHLEHADGSEDLKDHIRRFCRQHPVFCRRVASRLGLDP